MSRELAPSAPALASPARGALRRVLTALVAGGVLISSAGAAYADNIYNNLDPTIDAAVEAMALTVGGTGATSLLVDPTNNDGKNGCNLTGDKTLTLSLVSSDATVATVSEKDDVVSPGSVTFDACGNVRNLVVSALKAGTTTITASESSNSTGATFDLAPVSFTVTVSAAATTVVSTSDTTAPDAPTIDLLAASDTGSSDIDNHTNDRTPTLTGSAENGSMVEVFNGTESLGTTTATSAGTWTFTPETELLSGSYSFTAKAKDASGNVSAASSTLAVTIDGTAPNTPTINLVTASDTGSSTTDNVTSDRTPTLDGTAEAGSTVEVYRGASLLNTVTAAADGKWTATTAELVDGTHVLTAKAIDTAGNISVASLELTVVTDTAAPAQPSVDLDAGSDTGSSNSDDVTSDSTPTLKGAAEDGSSVEVFNGTVSLGTVTATSTGWSFTPTQALDGGAHTFTAKATDAAGNVSVASAPLTVTVDTVAPTQPLINLVDASDTGSSTTDNVTSDRTPTLDGTAEAGSTVEVYRGASLLNTVTAAADGKWTATTAELVDGTHVLTAKAIDTAGNISVASLELTVVTDTAAPAQPSVDLDAGSDTGSSNSDDVTSDSTPTLKGAAEDGSSVEVFNGTVSLGTVTATSTGWSFTPTQALDGGAHTFTAKATDAAGNVSVASAPLTVTVDTVAPNLQMNTTITDGASYHFGTVPVQPTCDASDALSGLAGICTITGYGTAVGSHTVAATATDIAGNQASVSRSYTVTPFTTKGFYQPVDMNDVLNTVKAGSSVPLKFELFRGATELTDIEHVKSVTQTTTTCPNAAPTDEIETLSTSTSGLKYDTTGGQYVYTLKAPSAGCYKVTMTAVDGSKITALFKTR